MLYYCLNERICNISYCDISSSFAYTMQLSTTYIATVGELESSFEMWSLCSFPPATVSPLIFPSLFCFMNMWYSNILFLWVLSSSFQWFLFNVFLKWSCFISECVAFWAFPPPLFPSCLDWKLSHIRCYDVRLFVLYFHKKDACAQMDRFVIFQLGQINSILRYFGAGYIVLFFLKI